MEQKYKILDSFSLESITSDPKIAAYPASLVASYILIKEIEQGMKNAELVIKYNLNMGIFSITALPTNFDFYIPKQLKESEKMLHLFSELAIDLNNKTSDKMFEVPSNKMLHELRENPDYKSLVLELIRYSLEKLLISNKEKSLEEMNLCDKKKFELGSFLCEHYLKITHLPKEPCFL